MSENRTEIANVVSKMIENRPSPSTLEERNILMDTKIAPALQETKKQLERSRLEDKLDRKLELRPPRERLVQDGILKNQDVAPSLQDHKQKA